jgi:hypothetical protein
MKKMKKSRREVDVLMLQEGSAWGIPDYEGGA